MLSGIHPPIINANDAYALFRAKGVNFLYHANTVQTSSIFLQTGSLLSRGAVDSRGLYQTSQKSDDLDKTYGIWNDLFFDHVDIHSRSKARNFYGPVKFILNLEFLLEDWLTWILVMKKNPSNWLNTDTMADRYFSNLEDLQQNFTFGDFGAHIVLRIQGGALPLAQHLNTIVLDNPAKNMFGVDVFSGAYSILKYAAGFAGFSHVPINMRCCQDDCACRGMYATLSDGESVKLFLPRAYTNPGYHAN